MKVDILGYEGVYQVDEVGNVYSLRFGKVKVLKPGVSYTGYYSVGLYKDNKSKNHRVQRLVACAFLADYDEDLQVDHIDEDKSNNSVSNLRMVSNMDNSMAYYINNPDTVNSGNGGKGILVDGKMYTSAYSAAKYIELKEAKLGNTRTHNTISKELRRFIAGKRPSWSMYGLYRIGH